MLCEADTRFKTELLRSCIFVDDVGEADRREIVFSYIITFLHAKRITKLQSPIYLKIQRLQIILGSRIFHLPVFISFILSWKGKAGSAPLLCHHLLN